MMPHTFKKTSFMPIDPDDRHVDDDLVAAEIAAGEKRSQI